jgi:hypothetical protein
MLRTSLILAAIALAPPAAALAEVITVRSDDGVDPATEAGRDPVVRGRVEAEAAGVYAGFTAATVPRPDATADVGVALGIRPRVWDQGMDLGYTRRVDAPCCGEVALRADRPFGADGSLGARVYFDAASDSAGAEARAAVTVVRGTRIDGGGVARQALSDPLIGVDFGIERALADLCRLDLRYRDAVLAPARAEMNLRMDF